MNRIKIKKNVWKRLERDYSLKQSYKCRYTEFDMNSAIGFTMDEYSQKKNNTHNK